MRFLLSVLVTVGLAGLMLAACGARPVSSVAKASPMLPAHASHAAIPAASDPPPPSPIPSTAKLASKCVTGVEDLTTSTFYPAAGFLAAGSTVPPGDSITGAYQVTLTNDSSVTAEVTGFAVVFYDGGGSETSSDSQGGFDGFITPGQSLSWTEDPWGDTVQNAPFAAGQMGAIDVRSTCQVVKWTHT